MIISEYDNTVEKQLNSLICHIDSNPKLIISPVEESSYLGITNYISDEGFHFQVKPIYEQYLEYLDKFIEQNSSDESAYTYISSTLKRLLSKYKNAKESIKESPLRIEWKTLSKYYTLPNPKNDFEISNQIKYTKEANNFFFKMSSVQLWFLDEILNYISAQLDEFKNNKYDIEQKEPVYYFKIMNKYSSKSYLFLSELHKGLNKIGYLDCSSPEFKKLFIETIDKIPENSPRPIVWIGDIYRHFAYLFWRLNGTFIIRTQSPSIYEIAINLIHQNVIDNKFAPKKLRYDGKIGLKAQKKIDAILDKAFEKVNK